MQNYEMVDAKQRKGNAKLRNSEAKQRKGHAKQRDRETTRLPNN